MLHKIQLLVARGGPEILAVVREFFFFLFALFIGERHAALFSEGRIGEHKIISLAIIGNERIIVVTKEKFRKLPLKEMDLVVQH